jgi:hypothetical protein
MKRASCSLAVPGEVMPPTNANEVEFKALYFEFRGNDLQLKGRSDVARVVEEPILVRIVPVE